MGKKSINVSISFDLYHKLENYCRENNLSKSRVISKAIETEILDDEPYNPDDLVFNRYDNVLIDMGRDLSQLRVKFLELDKRLDGLEKKHFIGNPHTLKDGF